MKKRSSLALLLPSILFGSLAAQNPVCPSTIFVELPNMNVLYAGIDNPIKVLHEGLSSSDYKVEVDRGTLTCIGSGLFNLNVSEPGEVVLTVTTYKGPKNYSFRVQRLPDPAPAFGGKYTPSDTMDVGVFKSQEGLALILEYFDFDAKCETVEYKITHIGNNHWTGAMFSNSVKNAGARFNSQTIELIEAGIPGDIFIFSNIKGRCPGDIQDRNLNGLVLFLGEKK